MPDGVGGLNGMLPAALLLLVATAALRPAVWRLVWHGPVDPRPAALTRVALALAYLWRFVELGPHVGFLFTDAGLWVIPPPESLAAGLAWLARELAVRAEGFSLLGAGNGAVVTWLLYGLLVASLVLTAVGWHTRTATIMSWLLAEQFYRFGPIFAFGADDVLRSLFFFGMFARWGDAWSVDANRGRRPLAVRHAPRRIPAWPMRLMMVQLAIVYSASGWTKTGLAWQDGSAIYYTLSLEALRRGPWLDAANLLQRAHVMTGLTWAVRWWEALFPLALLGAALRGYALAREYREWPESPRWRRWLSWTTLAVAWACAAGVAASLLSERPELLWLAPGPRPSLGATLYAALLLPIPLAVAYRLGREHGPGVTGAIVGWTVGRRVWLGFGVIVHLGGAALLDLGVFPLVMLAGYFPWLSGRDLEAFERLGPTRRTASAALRAATSMLYSRACGHRSEA